MAQDDTRAGRVLLTHDRQVRAMVESHDLEVVDLYDALARVWQDDAHFFAYEARTLPIADSERRAPARLLHEAKEGRPAVYDVLEYLDAPDVRMLYLIGDVDPPGHVASETWRAEVEHKLETSGLTWYRTRNGARVICPLPDPFTISTREHARLWWDLYLGWRQYLIDEHGIEVDPKCKDWTRCYRLPNVKRDGRQETADVHRGSVAFDLQQMWHTPSTELAPNQSAGSVSCNASLELLARAAAVAERMPPSVEGHGGDEALFQCACELASVTKGDTDVVAVVLEGVFNPRCLPPWPSSKLEYEGRRACERYRSNPAAQALDRIAERREQAPAKPQVTRAPEAWQDPWDNHTDFDAPLPEIDYYCEGLCIARCQGKVTVLGGSPNAGKSPIADHLAVCFSLGLSAFGVHACRRTNVVVLDWEGQRRTHRRAMRIAAALGRNPAELKGRLFVLDASRLGDPTSDEFLLRLHQKCEQIEAEVVIVDSYTSAMMASGIEPNNPRYAVLMMQLGKLDRVVICVAHANKASASAGKPRLEDIAYTGALGGYAETVIVAWHPDRDDKNLTRIGCARAPETEFGEFDIRFAGNKTEPLQMTVVNVENEQPHATEGRREIEKVREKLAGRERQADRLREFIEAHAEHDAVGVKVIREALGLNSESWAYARDICVQRGWVVEERLPGTPVRYLRPGGTQARPPDPGEVVKRIRRNKVQRE